VRLKGRLVHQPGVMVTSVPYQLRSSGEGDDAPDGPKEADILATSTPSA
jgi:hypothetical protein